MGVRLGAGAGGFFLRRAQRRGGIRGRGVGWGLPGAAGVRVAEGAVEPAGELEAQLQSVECVLVGAGEVVGGAVTHPAQHVEDLRDLVPHDPALLQHAQQIELVRRAVAVVGQEAGTRCGMARERLAQLAERDEREARIDRECAFGHGCQPQVQRAIQGQEGKAGGRWAVQDRLPRGRQATTHPTVSWRLRAMGRRVSRGYRADHVRPVRCPIWHPPSMHHRHRGRWPRQQTCKQLDAAAR